MANYEEAFASKLDWAMPFQRTGTFPLDRTDLFDSFEDAQKYAKGVADDPDKRGLCGSSYVGQIITVFENDVVSVYKISAKRELEQIGSSYELPKASADTLGGVKVGAGLEINPDTGVLSATGGGTADAVDWSNITSKPDFKDVATTGDYEDLLNKPSIPENLSDLTNDGNFVTDAAYVHTDKNFTEEYETKLQGISEGAEANVQADWNETQDSSDAFIQNKPTKLSDFVNDSNFIDNTVANLANYYDKSTVDEMLEAISTLDIQVVEQLPGTEEASSTTIYLVSRKEKWSNDDYDEYIYVKSTQKFELIGTTRVDLTTYLQKTGDGSEVTVKFEQAQDRTLPTTGQTLALIIGSIIKYLADLQTVAFTGDYSDLTGTPEEHPYLAIEQLTISAGSTSATTMTTFEDSTISSVFARDATTGEAVMVDWKLDDAQKIVAEISGEYANDIEINISYLKS